jgi:hypothetical protein
MQLVAICSQRIFLSFFSFVFFNRFLRFWMTIWWLIRYLSIQQTLKRMEGMFLSDGVWPVFLLLLTSPAREVSFARGPVLDSNGRARDDRLRD